MLQDTKTSHTSSTNTVPEWRTQQRAAVQEGDRLGWRQGLAEVAPPRYRQWRKCVPWRIGPGHYTAHVLSWQQQVYTEWSRSTQIRSWEKILSFFQTKWQQSFHKYQKTVCSLKRISSSQDVRETAKKEKKKKTRKRKNNWQKHTEGLFGEAYLLWTEVHAHFVQTNARRTGVSANGHQNLNRKISCQLNPLDRRHLSLPALLSHHATPDHPVAAG